MVEEIEGLKYFFTFITNVPRQFATPVLSIRHITVLLFFFLIFGGLTVGFKNKKKSVRRTYILVVACMLFVAAMAEEVWLLSIGHFTFMTELPLQLCGTMYVIIPLTVITQNRTLMEFVYSCGMPGAFLALLTPTIQGYYFISFGYLIFMFIHTLIVYVPVFLLVTGELKPQLRSLHKSAGIFFFLVILDFVVDRVLGSNYLYLNWAPNGTLLATFAKWVGTPEYIFLALVAVPIVWTALYLPWELYYRAKQQPVRMRSTWR